MEPFSPLLLPSKPPDLAQAPPGSNPNTMAFIGIRALRRTTVLVGTLNIAIAVAGTLLVALLLRRCGARLKFSVAAVSIAAAVKVGCMLATGISQGVMASFIARQPIDGSVREDIDFRRERKVSIPFKASLKYLRKKNGIYYKSRGVTSNLHIKVAA